MASITLAHHAALISPQSLKSSSHKARDTDRLWDAALERYYDTLDDDDEANITDSVNSFKDVLDYARATERVDFVTFGAYSRIEPTLGFINDFAAIVALYKGSRSHVVAVIWTSLLRIITLVAGASDVLQNVLDMLDELSLSLPHTRHYECTLPKDGPLEASVAHLYSEMICFYARIIRHHKLNPHLPLQHAAWQIPQRDFASTLKRIKYLSTAVEKNLDLAELRMERARQEQMLKLLKAWDLREPVDHIITDCHYIPLSLNRRFQDRDEDLLAIQQALQHAGRPMSLKCLVLHGMGGVGKTQLALKYAIHAKKQFDTILWIAADTSLSLEQSFYKAAIELGLNNKSESGFDEFAAMARVRNWLSNPKNGLTGNLDRTWLIIYDNADDIDVLRHAWPTNGFGSVLITSRDSNAPSTLASQALDLKPFNTENGAQVLLRLLGNASPTLEQKREAAKIAHKLGGLPLALDQIAGFITHRKMRLQDFLSLYDRHAAQIDAKNQEVTDYPHSLAAMFELSLSQLKGPAFHLQNLLAFLEPDLISEDLLEEGVELISDPDFDFLSNELEFGDAEEVLLKAALIHKDMDEQSLSVHRLVQAATLRRLDQSMQRKYFAAATDLLRLGFPDRWSKDVGHQKAQWDRCERYLPHVNRLIGLVTGSVDIVERPDSWAELLLRSSWYLFEKEQFEYAEAFVMAALSSFTRRETLAYANAIDLLGMIHLYICEPQKALEAFGKALSIRQHMLPPTDPLLALSFNNLGLAYTELPNLEKATVCHRKAIELRLSCNSDRIGNSYSNYASLLLRLGQPDKAEKMLRSCPSLANWTDNTFLEMDNPRFVGDMILLSRIYRAQGKRSDAIRLATKALAWRKNVHGDRFKTCEAMYGVASLLHDSKQDDAALNLLAQLVKVSETLPWGEGHAARAEYKMSVICARMQNLEKSLKHKDRALDLRAVYRPQEADAPFDEASFDRLNMFMMW